MFQTPSSRLFLGLIPWYSLLIVIGIVLALYLAQKEEKRLDLPKDTVVDLALLTIPLGIIGARVYYVLFSWELYASNPISVLYLWEGGLAIYGGLIGGIAGVLITAYRKKISLLSLLDVAATGVLLAQAIGRWGNYFNMEAYGEVIDNAAYQFFPFAVYIPADGNWHMATFFYESLWDFLMFFALYLNRKKLVRKGDYFLWYSLLYASVRCFIEGLRTDSLMWGGIRVSQMLALAVIFAVLIIYAVLVFRNGRKIRALVLGSLFVLLPGAAILLGAPGVSFLCPVFCLILYRNTMEENKCVI